MTPIASTPPFGSAASAKTSAPDFLLTFALPAELRGLPGTHLRTV